MTVKWNSRPGMKGPALTAVVLAAALCVSGCGATAPDSGQADKLALAVVDNLATGNAAVTKDFSPAMAKAVPAADLSQNWKRFQASYGNYGSHGQPQDVPQGALTVVNLPLAMERKPGQLRVTVDQTGHVAGLFLLDASTPMPPPTSSSR